MSEPRQAATLIRHRDLEVDTWKRFEPTETRPLPADDEDWLVPLAVWQSARAELRGRRRPVGVLLGPADDPAELAEDGRVDPAGVALIAVDFPIYTDGRGYSIAYLLRTRLGWQGELRAVGDVMIDTIHYQARSGFDSFAVKHGHDPEQALRAFGTFTAAYQQSYPVLAARQG
ncbi:DUF934 domain-containing protein [Pigmentiphaga sp.]|uniref:DUF934 domain-containing protein n=1 Tax=Pigmentiphaga sp. TaxID=1977564 RepID=UPI00128AFD04|nr:DUF934 domain-containing protein [Pigmentiphaga sp.]MPS27676.1 DUF934 domain-containing protein [Alcaligenaceae bacterium SAGV5]MPS54200.1 DUF934 domain-containing protein [Alcaligenaceae bacterium SAGV3]MPT58269.1 DUF934 domain-containing protein [Alcaligenaceae bacterium]